MRCRPLPLALLAACGTGAPEATWHGEARAIVEAKCATCHQPGDIAPFPLTTLEEVRAFEAPVRMSIENGTMPPWMPDNDCNTYVQDFDLTDDERQLLLEWLDAGTPEGDPDASMGAEPVEDTFRADLEVRLPQPYTPVREPDDYRCQIVDLGITETTYSVGLRVVPDQRAIVHHTLAFLISEDEVESYQAMDDAEEGPGYTCFGGPTASEVQEGEGGGQGSLIEDLTPEQIADVLAGNLPEGFNGGGGLSGSLGSWVPGVPSQPYPAGTGIKLDPGDHLVVQMHYNTLTASPVADQSTIQVMLSDTVEREATRLPLTDLAWVTGLPMFGEPMTIPAGEASVTHSTVIDADSLLMKLAKANLGLSDDDTILIHGANLHMHELGVQTSFVTQHADGTETCGLDIPDWDFKWQGDYSLTTPIRLAPEDTITLSCTWDNSPENQYAANGEAREPTDVEWGEGTGDEMCLGSLYITAE